jgi:hypothetical protein
MNIGLKIVLLLVGGGLIGLFASALHVPIVVVLIVAFLYGWYFDKLFEQKDK